MLRTAYVEIRQIQEDDGQYTVLIAKDLDHPNEDYIWCTILPNWNHINNPLPGDRGYLRFMIAEAGVATWYDPLTGKHIPYKFNNAYYEGFVKEKPTPTAVLVD